jgi:hypothetical protein
MPPFASRIDETRAKLDRLMSGGGAGEVATCDTCGSTYFYAVNAEQYSQGFGSVEYNALSANPRPTKVCLCGTPLPTKNSIRGAAQTRGAQEEFLRSLTAARDYREANSIKAIAKIVASPSELEDLKASLNAKIAELTETISKLPAPVTKSVPNKKTVNA